VNDTGLTLCADASDQWTDQCAGTGQDAEFGRDATHPGSADGAAGFSFVRVCNSGEWAGTGACPQRPKRGQGPNDWGCNHDRVTGLTWERTAVCAGSAIGACRAWGSWSRSSTGRMPNFKEMLSIVDTRLTGIAFDNQVFPGTPADTIYWTSTTHMFPDTASTSPIVWANAGDSGLSDHEFPLAVRLVRDAR
jgi:hypothetical protein